MHFVSEKKQRGRSKVHRSFGIRFRFTLFSVSVSLRMTEAGVSLKRAATLQTQKVTLSERSRRNFSRADKA
jgi:hypothetical protein